MFESRCYECYLNITAAELRKKVAIRNYGDPPLEFHSHCFEKVTGGNYMENDNYAANCSLCGGCPDKGWVEIIHWQGRGAYLFHGDCFESVAGIHYMPGTLDLNTTCDCSMDDCPDAFGLMHCRSVHNEPGRARIARTERTGRIK